MIKKIGISGIGFVGGAIYNFFKNTKIEIILYDKFKNEYVNNLENMLDTELLFLCLPTLFNNDTNEYDKTSIYENLDYLNNNNYKGVCVIKSTIEPETCEKLTIKYNKLNIIHNPEFLSAKTACEDFKNQQHIVLGKPCCVNEQILNNIYLFYKEYFPNAQYSLCTSTESELMKISCNSFYSVKIQFFNEIYLLCDKINCNYDNVKDLMLKNNWINKMHTNVPGHDGKLSYGGACFPKDTNALSNYMLLKII